MVESWKHCWRALDEHGSEKNRFEGVRADREYRSPVEGAGPVWPSTQQSGHARPPGQVMENRASSAGVAVSFVPGVGGGPVLGLDDIAHGRVFW